MRRLLTFFVALLSVISVSAQDNYHTQLVAQLAADYDLTDGTFLFSPNESNILNASFNWGSQRSNITVGDQPFTRAARVSVNQAGNNPWDAGYFINPSVPLAQGDIILWVFNIRSLNGDGRVSVIAERTSDFAKEVSSNLDVGPEWTQYFVAFRVGFGPHAPAGFQMGFHLAGQAQTIEIGGLTALKYENRTTITGLPNAFDPANYEGNEADAPWRASAAERIDQLRKANVTVRTVTTSGSPVNNVPVDIKMQEHEFAFGTAIKACRLANNSCANAIFQNRLTNLDGAGHGFNWVVFENDLKWPAWEEEWLATNEEVIRGISWLRERNLKIRGHVILWPGNENLPEDVRNNRSDTSYVLNRIREHINTMATLPGLGGQIEEWDLINETVTNTSLEEAFRGQGNYLTGRELFAQVFREAKAAMPDVKLYYNDFVTLTLNNRAGSTAYDAKMRNVREILASGATIDGIGFQGHIGASPNGIPGVLNTLDDFYDNFGLEARITEFDLPASVPEEVSSKYLGDFLTATFSHPSMSGFLFWNFWDTDTWMNPGANLYNANWTPTASHAVFVDKLFNEWWTNETITTDAQGDAAVRAFKGQYLISYVCGTETITQQVSLTADTTLTLSCDDFLSATPDQFDDSQLVSINPNPAANTFTVSHPFRNDAELTVFNTLGQELLNLRLSQPNQTITNTLPAGSYVVRIEDGIRVATKRLIIN